MHMKFDPLFSVWKYNDGEVKWLTAVIEVIAFGKTQASDEVVANKLQIINSLLHELTRFN